jgi:hypothetical protein
MDVQKNQQLSQMTVGENQADGTFDEKKKKKGEDFDETVDDLKDPSEESDAVNDEEEEEEQDPDSDKDKA